MEKILINKFTKSPTKRPTNFEFLLLVKKNPGRLVHTENFRGFTIIQKKMPCFFTCLSAEKKGHHTLCHRKDPAFISRGVKNWEKAGERFSEY